MPHDIDDEPTLVHRTTGLDLVELDDPEALLDARDERDELLEVLDAPDGIEEMVFAHLLRDIYDELVHRSGLERARPAMVAAAATPEALIALATGRTLCPDSALAALLRPEASA